jgi:hypothetical protein
MRQKYCLVLLVFYFISVKSISQETRIKDKLFFEGFYHYGFVSPHHNYMAYFINEHVQSFQFNIGIYTTGEKLWHKYYNYPAIGIGFHHSSLGNNDIYGHMDAVYLFTDRYFGNNNNVINFGNRISLGACYVNKCYNLYSNPFNMAMSTKINIYINYSLETDIRLFPQTDLKFGIALNHISNGNIKEPNKGINFITSFVGLKYSLSDPKNIRKSFLYKKPDSTKNQILIAGSFGIKNNSRFTNTTYPVYALSLEYSRKISRTGWMGLVLTNYYDYSLKNELETENSSYTYKNTDPVRIALNLSYEMRMGNLSYLFQPGIYIKNAYKHTGNITNRIGLRYYFPKRFTASLMVKAHWVAIADVIEWGIGYKFNH